MPHDDSRDDGHDAGRDWGGFPHTVLYFSGSSGPDTPCIWLEKPVSDSDHLALIGLGLGGSFGVVTAQDPMGVTQPPGLNAEMAAKLQREIVVTGVSFVTVDACNPDRSHCERSVAVVMELAEVVDLACKYNQLAIFWFDGTAFWIIPARSSKERVRLPLVTAPDHS